MSFTLPTALTTLWDKFTAWFKGEVKAVEVVFTNEEQAVISALSPILHAAEPVALAALIDFVRNVLTSAVGVKDLPTWEAAVLNEAEALGGQLFTLAKGLGSNLLQALIAVLLAGLPQPPAANP